VNGFLGLSYPLPDGFYDNTGESLASHAGESPNGIFYLLVADRSAGGANRNRILLVADDASHYATGFTVKDYVVRMAQALGTHGVGSGADPSAVQFGGQDFFRADFHQDVKGGVQYKAFMATLAHGYFLSWTFVAMAQPQLDELVNSLQKVAFTAGETARPNSDAANPGATAPATTGQVPTSGPPMRVRVSEKVFQALLVKKVNPIYPATARDARIQGSVLLRVVVSRDGDVTEVTLISGHPMLVDSAIQAVKQWKFKPYLLNGEPVEVETQTMVNYELHRY
jgi:TonB family protein